MTTKDGGTSSRKLAGAECNDSARSSGGRLRQRAQLPEFNEARPESRPDGMGHHMAKGPMPCEGAYAGCAPEHVRAPPVRQPKLDVSAQPEAFSSVQLAYLPAP
jgi:hypothetical protein